jgi:pSer/pThr/pTyr-binding forkhead associated (FHA) protein
METSGVIQTRFAVMKSPPTITVQLVHIQGPHKGDIQEFTQEAISIGRHPDCHVRFPANLTVVSRRHAEIRREGIRFKITDKNSTNGTYVNGKKVNEIFLKDGDVIAFSETGPKVSFLTQLIEAQADSTDNRESSAGRAWAQPSREPTGAIVADQPAPKTEEVPVGTVRVPLVVQYGPTLRSFKELPIVIGKSPKCDLAIAHPALLDRHVQIFYWQDRYWVKDLTGQKLIRINQSPIGVQAPLNTDDDLSLSPEGPSFRFLGEGRLAEVEPSALESGSASDDNDRHTSEPPASGERDPQKPASLFKKLFSR